MPAISIRDISKCYTLGREVHDSLRDQIAGLFRKRASAEERTFWALRGVSFDVEEGETLGVIGHNGAGKSTLLKILAQVTDPTDGEVRIRGRVGSLLEVGTGFHPELTGRENVFINGAILGLTRREIGQRFAEIVAFAEVEKFIDTPVKHYSSGMSLRLAFSVAAHLQPEVLLVDEILAVGDSSFQRRCLGKMKEISQSGRTILFVSHNMTAVESLCSRVAWLRGGQVLKVGPAEEIVSEYLGSETERQTAVVWPDAASAPGNDLVRIRSAQVAPLGEASDGLITIGSGFTLEFELWNQKDGAALGLSIFLVNEDGVFVCNTLFDFDEVRVGEGVPSGLLRARCTVPGHLLNEGTYRVLFRATSRGVNNFIRDDLLVFRVHNDQEWRRGRAGKWPGVIRPQLAWQSELVP
jgi:lipopolysaccharide transport system ATP-binding protein